MDPRHRIDEAYKRKLQRIKVRSADNSFQFALAGKRFNSKFHQFKCIVLLVLLIAFLTILSSTNVYYQNCISHTISRCLWGAKVDHRYLSDMVLDWQEISQALKHIPRDLKFNTTGLLNYDEHEIDQWKQFMPDTNHKLLQLDYVDKNLTWSSLYPEWIDEEQEDEVPSCPSLPSLEVPLQRLDLIALKLPCKGNWTRDIVRLHLQISVARLAASYKGLYPIHVMILTQCFPIPNLFTWDDLIAREGNTWLYQPNLSLLREKLHLPVGSCELSLPLGGLEKGYIAKRPQREAYATILHSVYSYVCGAIVAAQSIRKSGSTKDLVILVDETISENRRKGLELAGWQVRTIQRIRNPKAQKDSYNEWNYSKFRLWQLTDYDKIIFIDADMLVLRNIDSLFLMPEISATGNAGPLFNSGVMVIEPSNKTFDLLMEHINDIESYNGGDQGFLNEIFTWWHRIPRRVNFLKHIWIGDDDQVKKKKALLFEADPPVLYVLHYLGNKPWMCFRDYDCNWNVEWLQEFASDVAHRTWWKVHDSMSEELQEFCMMRTVQKATLEHDRREAERANFSDGHWRIKIRDKRMDRCIDEHHYCSWEEMLKQWGKKSGNMNSTR